MFVNTIINLGKIKVGSKNVFQFPYSDVDYISRVTSPCVCTDVSNHVREKVIRGSYTPKPIPDHLKLEGVTEQPIKYTITVKYVKDGHEITQELTFTATIIE